MQSDDFNPFALLWNVLKKHKVKIDKDYRPPPPRPLRPSSDEMAELALRKEIPSLEDFKDVLTRDGGSFQSNGVGIVVYIAELRLRSWSPRRWLLSEEEIRAKYLRKVHLVQCGAINRMLNQGLYDKRYFKTRRSNRFIVTTIDGKEPQKDLDVCEFCLGSELIRRKFGTKYGPSDFPIGEFLQETSFPLDARPDTDIPPPVNSDKLMRKYKELMNWKCEGCGVNLGDRRRLLHCHHKDRNWRNNDASNYKALCISCHAGEHPGNHWLCNQGDLNQNDLSEVGRFQQEQGIDPPNP